MIQAFIVLLTVPYFRIYKRNTYDPLKAIAREQNHVRLEPIIENWIIGKRSELEYVSVAGAVLFASVPTCLQWADIKTVHWTAPAFWYASIVLAVTAVILAAQQTMVLSSLQKTSYTNVRDRLTKAWTAEPKSAMLHIWQIPVQCLSYSIVAFMIGLFSYVFSPLAQNPVWDGTAKTAVTFGVVMVFIAFNIVWSSAWVYNMDD